MEPHFIFPIPIATAENKISADEYSKLVNLDYITTSNGEYYVTKDMNVLDCVPDLKSWIAEQLNLYSMNSLATSQKLKFTQSWCLKHEPKTVQTVTPHPHPNSIISGAYYVEAHPGSTSLKFHRSNALSAPTVEWARDSLLQKDRHWTWEAYEVPAVTGKLVLFPSYVNHTVGSKELSPYMRCVLSFNTWFDGPIGENAYRLGETI